jgi:hypothetical protein
MLGHHSDLTIQARFRQQRLMSEAEAERLANAAQSEQAAQGEQIDWQGRLMSRVGDGLIAVGTRLKSRSQLPLRRRDAADGMVS